MYPKRFSVVEWLLLGTIAVGCSDVALALVSDQTGLKSNPTGGIASADGFINPIRVEDAKLGWIALWDGQTTFGWRNTKSSSIEDGVWELSQEDSVVRTAAEFKDFELNLEYSLEADGEAELLIHTNPVARKPGLDHGMITLPRTPSKEFETLNIRNVDGYIRLNQDSSEAAKGLEFESPKRGYLGFRVKSGILKIRRLTLRPEIPASKPGTITVTDVWKQNDSQSGTTTYFDNVMRLKEGPFHLTFSWDEFRRKYPPVSAEELANLENGMLRDFAMQFECKSSENTNSGIFFRCIPGEKLNGYEAQINNQFQEGDPTKPVDCGTGGIFRRCDARRIVAGPDQWFTETIIVNGAQISVWVDGYQVTDWSDQRAPHPNPRKGKRIEAGELQIQSHDEATDISFRRMRIDPYLKRGSKPNLPK